MDATHEHPTGHGPDGRHPNGDGTLSAEQRRERLGRLLRRKRDEGTLSYAQERLWFLHELEPDNAAYNLAAAFRLDGPLDAAALARALTEVAGRHEILRATFASRKGKPVQVIGPPEPVEVPPEDLGGIPERRREQAAAALAAEEARTPFDLAAGPLLRARLLRLGPERHVLLVTAHRIVADDRSMGLLAGELGAAYDAFVAGRAPALPELPRQYPDFAAWQRQRLDAKDDVPTGDGSPLAEELDYWRGRLGSDPPAAQLPTDHPRPAMQSYRGGRAEAAIGPELAGRIRALADAEGTSLFTTLLAGLKALLARYSRQDDLVVGTTVSDPGEPDLAPLIGLFANTLALRTDVSGDPSFAELLARVRATCMGAFAHQEVPFERLLLELQPERDLSRTPLFQVVLEVAAERPAPRMTGVEATTMPVATDRAGYDLTIQVTDTPDGLAVRADYAADLFDDATVERLLDHWTRLLDAATTDPSQPISRLPLLGPEERDRLLVGFNDTDRAVPDADRGLHELFERQVRRTPDAAALIAPTERLTYRQLDQRANQLAHHLRALGVAPEAPVGICVERSPEAVVAVLAVLKAGGAYLPMDPNHPAERLRFMLDDAGARVLVTREGVADRLADRLGSRDVVRIDTDWPAIAGRPATAADPVNAPPGGPDRLAYVLYTSGSTGAPKGVLGLHRGMVNTIAWLHEAYPFEADEVAVQRTSLSFVDAIWELFAPLTAGIPVVIATDDVVADPERFIDLLAERRVTRIVMVPSLLRALLQSGADLGGRLPSLRLWFSSGEALPADLLRRLRERMPDAVLVNVYGTSEVSADATYHDTRRDDGRASVPIGRPIANAKVYLLDPTLEPVPIGVAGEICVGGVGLARGYLNRPDLTAERFVDDPFSGMGQRMYRTGDLGRYLPDGGIEYLGRADHQVKIRGFRIELGEVESVLVEHDGLAEAAVVAVDDRQAGARLVAYAVPADSAEPAVDELREFLAGRLPEYMVPSTFVMLDRLPRTPSGKIDRPSLPAPDSARPDLGQPYAPPQTPTEEALAAIYAELLGVERVGVNDDFFSLGGHSLLVIQLLARIREEFQVEFPMRSLYETSTVAALATAVEAVRHAGIDAAPTALDALPDFERTTVLDPDIRPEDALPYTPSEPRSILLTGGTGFLGVHLLYELMEQTDADVYCLVRASSVEKGKLRLKEKMAGNDLWDPKYSRRIVPVLGDLTKRLFGMPQERFDELATTVDAIYHSGAYVNFVFPYSALRAANVGGTQEAIRFACHRKLKPLHHISLTDVALRRDDEGVWRIDETPATEYPRGIFMSGYAQTKWVAERLVTIAQERGLPVTIYRPGFIEGHSETGYCNTSSELCLTLKGCIDLGVAPDHDMMFDAAPVDYASKAFVYLSRKPDSIGRIFGAVCPWPVPLRKMIDWIDGLGYPLERVPYPEWRQRVIDRVADDPTHPLYPLLPYSTDEEIARMPLAFPCDTTNTLTGLEGSGIRCAPIEPKLVEVCLTYLSEVGFLEPPAGPPPRPDEAAVPA